MVRRSQLLIDGDVHQLTLLHTTTVKVLENKGFMCMVAITATLTQALPVNDEGAGVTGRMIGLGSRSYITLFHGESS